MVSLDIVAAAVLSGNRNFEGRVHALTRANYLASPPLVMAYALAGTVFSLYNFCCTKAIDNMIKYLLRICHVNLLDITINEMLIHISDPFFIRLTLILKLSQLELERTERVYISGISGLQVQKLQR